MARNRKPKKSAEVSEAEVAETRNPEATRNDAIDQNVENIDPRTVKLGHAVEVVIERPASKEGGKPTTTEKKYASKSQAILDLHTSHNMDVSSIAKALGIRYQFAYNVLKRNNKLGR